ncbi:NID1 [Cordylochernes scorpioides]|uniref:NID1 n=1 Tax=Cordylochernes scorpioides TaxID=51811 RepID=A0ABY6LI34_9ARAC|nr:NID1 [Cordylochernes scorpioides]
MHPDYNTGKVNDNGLLSFLTEVPSFFNAQFPLTYPIIAPYYADADTRGTGTVTYRIAVGVARTTVGGARTLVGVTRIAVGMAITALGVVRTEVGVAKTTVGEAKTLVDVTRIAVGNSSGHGQDSSGRGQNRSGCGRDTRSPELLARVGEIIRNHFSSGARFQPASLFIATWNGVGHYDRDGSKRNTFQAVIASDGRDTYVLLVYPDGGLRWTRGSGKNPHLPDARAQAGFMPGDGRLHALPGSGTDRMLNLHRMTNVGEPGLWAFHVSPSTGVREPDLDSEEPPGATCSNTLRPCPPTAICRDHAGGFCCVCPPGSYGNGWSCLCLPLLRVSLMVSPYLLLQCFPLLRVGLMVSPYLLLLCFPLLRVGHMVSPYLPPSMAYSTEKPTHRTYTSTHMCMLAGEALRLNGKLSGSLNDVPLRDADLHAYVVTEDGRAYTAISNVPPSVGFDMQALTPLAGAVSWLFAVPSEPGAENGFSLTGGCCPLPRFGRSLSIHGMVSYGGCPGGLFNRTVAVEFRQSGHRVDIHERYMGLDVFGYLRATVEIRGSLPTVAFGGRLVVEDYTEEFSWEGPDTAVPGTLTSKSQRTYRLEDNVLDLPLEVEQTIHYEGCPHAPPPAVTKSRLRVARNFIVYDSREQIVRYATSNRVTVGGTVTDPCAEVRCGQFQRCVPEGDTYRCLCVQGYDFVSPDECRDIDECLAGRSNCHPHLAECTNLPGSFSCSCRQGYTGDGVQCDRAVTCSEVYCDVNAECVEGQGCRCLPGFHGDGHSCRPLDRCGPGGCPDPNSECIYRPDLGSYTCSCRGGYVGDGQVCRPANDLCPPGRCHERARCHPQTGECVCDPGYYGDGFQCQLEDPNAICSRCHPNAQCIYDHSYSVYLCQCSHGFSGDGYRCSPLGKFIEIQESSEYGGVLSMMMEGVLLWCGDRSWAGLVLEEVGGSFISVVESECGTCHAYARCQPDPYLGGRSVCRCLEGYDGDGYTCSPIWCPDECSTYDDCDANAQCAYDPESQHYRCLCNPGWRNGGSRTCVPDTGIPVTDPPPPPPQPCGGYCDSNADCDEHGRCVCRHGYIGDGRSCRESCLVVNTCSVHGECVPTGDCRCRAGWAGDGYTCRPLRSCREDPGLCHYAADCLDDGRCVCRSGWIGDGFDCRETAHHADGDFLLFGQGMSVLKMPRDPTRDNPGHLLLMEPRQTVLGLDVDCQDGRVYWTDMAHRALRSARYNGSDSRFFLHGVHVVQAMIIMMICDIQSPEDVAVDWVARNIFWTDSLSDTLSVTRLDNPLYSKILLSQDMNDPRGLAVHPGRGKIFWTDWSRINPRIESANMDGTERQVLASTEMGLPNMVAVDLMRDDICWTDAAMFTYLFAYGVVGLNKIECMALDGSRRRVVYTPAAYPFGLTIVGSYVYWTDWTKDFIQRVDKNGGEVERLELPLGGNGKLFGLVAAPAQCPRVSNPCAVQNGNCPHLCLPNGRGGRVCACPDNIDCSWDQNNL